MKLFHNRFKDLLRNQLGSFDYSLSDGKITVLNDFFQTSNVKKSSLWEYLRETPISYILSAPIIYGMIIPIVLLDLTITLYQHICFRIYKIPLVNRDDYIVIDRHHLPYLNVIEKLNCVYCGYGNGLIAYVREIMARTEQFWCPIKHAQKENQQHERSKNFVNYGDAKTWERKRDLLRKKWD